MEKIRESKVAMVAAGAVVLSSLAYMAMPSTPNPLFKKTAQTKHGRYTRSLPWTYRATFKRALAHAEAKHGRPVYIIEVAESWSQISYKPYMNCMIVFLCGADCYQNDEIMADQNLEKFTLNPALQGDVFELYSDRKDRKFPLYSLTPNLRLVANETTPTINFDHLKELLLSQGDSRREEYETLIKGDFKFLDKKSLLLGNRVALASYPRTGNSFLRKTLEQITGVFSGSDMHLDLTITLQQQGMLGEQTVDNSCWIVKTHFPINDNPTQAFDADKIIYITRHPVDVIPSQASLMFTMAHSIEPKKPWSEYQVWKPFCDMMIPLFKKFD